MSSKPLLLAMDLEGVLVPEVWISVAEKTGIAELRLTTRDFSDYNALMRHRMAILDQHQLTLADIQEVISTMQPLPGAIEYLDWLRPRHQAIILSDTFYEFASPLMRQLGWPTLFCNTIHSNDKGQVTGYTMRVDNGKKKAAVAFQQLNFQVIAMGDSYNDTEMLKVADLGILFRPSENVKQEFPQFPTVTEYQEVIQLIEEFERR